MKRFEISCNRSFDAMQVSYMMHDTEKDGGCTFNHNALQPYG